VIIADTGPMDFLDDEVVAEVCQGLLSLEEFFDLVGTEVVRRVRLYTSESRPSARLPKRLGGGWTGPRKAHPGGWGDITHLLEQSYRHEVIRDATEVVLGIINDDPEGYGAELEQRMGFFVVHGLDDPGGLIDQVIMVMIARAPDWQLESGYMGA
jgi:hypothetical protein